MYLRNLTYILKTTNYTLPKCNYDFLQKIVIYSDNKDIAITPRLSYDQYKLAKKLMIKYKDQYTY